MRLTTMLVLLVFLGVCSTGTTYRTSSKYLNEKKIEPRIIGGVDAERNQFPHIVSLQRFGQHMCGGSILSSTWVVTAGHCCEERSPQSTCSKFEVVAGLLHLGEHHPDVQNVPVAHVVHHPDYHHIPNKEVNNDIALLKLSFGFKFTHAVKAINLPSKFDTTGEAWVAGWGIYKRLVILPVTLQCIKVQIIDSTDCQEYLNRFDKNATLRLFDTMVCTLPPTGLEEICFGDSGGPLSYNDTLIGIVSWAVLCIDYHLGAPSVFTAVNKYIDFINMHVNDLPV